jgi:hypothetical protein
MRQGTCAFKPWLPASDHGDLDVFSRRGDRTGTANCMQGTGAQGGPAPLPTPALHDAPIRDAADAPQLDQRGLARGLAHGLHEVRAAGL